MARAWCLKSRPSGMPIGDNFELKDFGTTPLGDGEIRVANEWLSVTVPTAPPDIGSPIWKGGT